MSANWSMRSKGRPYFVFCQPNLGGMDATGLGAYGAVEMEVEFRLHALPPAYADPNEIHSLMEFGHFIVGTRWLTVGITPSGRYVAASRPEDGGPIAYSYAGAIVPDGLWHTAYVLWDGSTGDILLRVDGDAAYTANTGVAGYAIPALGEVMLFNGHDMLARSDVSIRSAWMSFSGAGSSSGVVRWKVNEKFGLSIQGTKETDGSYPLVTSFALQGAYRPPLRFPAVYGGIPDTEPDGSAFAWSVGTDYTEVPAPETAYTEVDVE